MSNLNKWNEWYSNVRVMESYGSSSSYKIGADYLSECSTVEDWGCGKGWLRQFFPKTVSYIGVDGSHNKFVDKQVDLENYKSDVEAIFMRHVLEHNYGWKNILSNAVDSFQKKMVLIFFTPWSEKEVKEIGFTNSVGVPDLAFCKEEIESYFKGLVFKYMEIQSPETFYGVEYIYLIQK